MRVVIAGSRSIKGDEAVELINQAVEKSGWTIDEVISGDAPGIDTGAIEWAKTNDIDYVRMPANWPKYPNKSAGYKRNQKMAWYAKVVEQVLTLQGKKVEDRYKGGLIAIWKGGSKGTGHMIDIAREMDLKVFVLTV
jgi:hypothetical protein